MTKAVFIDYTGTIITQGGKDAEEMVYRVCKNSSMKDPQKFLKYWWGMIKEYEASFWGADYITEDEIVDKMLARCVAEIDLQENLEDLHALCQRFWMYAPFYDDVKEFFKKCPYPIYIISNNGKKYISEAMRVNGISPAGIITADMVQAYKPHPALFRKALVVSGCTADEAVHIGDSVTSDINGANTVGIKAILLDRDGKYGSFDIPTAKNLFDTLKMI
ncbi:MAG: HAD family hydrolase [Oscillospiraceae bacterium]|nr:HAD family hydrolase [Oscillospiraceae bacterium]